jgi:hypothetical protein
MYNYSVVTKRKFFLLFLSAARRCVGDFIIIHVAALSERLSNRARSSKLATVSCRASSCWGKCASRVIIHANWVPFLAENSQSLIVRWLNDAGVRGGGGRKLIQTTEPTAHTFSFRYTPRGHVPTHRSTHSKTKDFIITKLKVKKKLF